MIKNPLSKEKPELMRIALIQNLHESPSETEKKRQIDIRISISLPVLAMAYSGFLQHPFLIARLS